MDFTSKQREIVARKLGYDGPMQGFDEYINSSPALGMQYANITDKFAQRMAKGGVVSKKPVEMAEGGLFSFYGLAPESTAGVSATPTASTEAVAAAQSAQKKAEDDLKASQDAAEAERRAKPQMNTTGTTYQAATTDITPGMTAQAATAAPVKTATAAQIDQAATVAAPTPITAAPITAATAAPAVAKSLEGVQSQQGAVSQQAQAAAATQAPDTTAVAGVEAAQGVAAQVDGAPTRTAQEGEMVAGPAVDMAKAEQVISQTQAAQGAVTEDMTVQGQLNKLLSNFDAGTPPPWAAGSLRAATAQLAARGLGASSLAGQAIIQATLEAATPIAAADAKVFEQMGLQNLSNRQAIAVLTGQQRAVFLGQEFDQGFQTRVLNAARIADIANKNFDAQTTIALENARLTNTMDIANLSAKNAVVLEKAAAMSRLETQNLSNRQQAAVQNAQAFLQMDVKNLDNRQQTMLFKAQEVADALVSDAGFENATRAANATNKLDADKISATLALTAQQFSATERNKVAMANMDATNQLVKFNAQEANDREEFNANLSSSINIANAKILADVSTANTAATNAAYAVGAKNSTDLSAAAYAQQSQTYRDLLEYSWKTGEQEKDRVGNIAVATITRSAASSATQITADAASNAAWGKLAFDVVKNWDSVTDFFT